MGNSTTKPRDNTNREQLQVSRSPIPSKERSSESSRSKRESLGGIRNHVSNDSKLSLPRGREVFEKRPDQSTDSIPKFLEHGTATEKSRYPKIQRLSDPMQSVNKISHQLGDDQSTFSHRDDDRTDIRLDMGCSISNYTEPQTNRVSGISSSVSSGARSPLVSDVSGTKTINSHSQEIHTHHCTLTNKDKPSSSNIPMDSASIMSPPSSLHDMSSTYHEASHLCDLDEESYNSNPLTRPWMDKGKLRSSCHNSFNSATGMKTPPLMNDIGRGEVSAPSGQDVGQRTKGQGRLSQANKDSLQTLVSSFNAASSMTSSPSENDVTATKDLGHSLSNVSSASSMSSHSLVHHATGAEFSNGCDLSVASSAIDQQTQPQPNKDEMYCTSSAVSESVHSPFLVIDGTGAETSNSNVSRELCNNGQWIQSLATNEVLSDSPIEHTSSTVPLSLANGVTEPKGTLHVGHEERCSSDSRTAPQAKKSVHLSSSQSITSANPIVSLPFVDEVTKTEAMSPYHLHEENHNSDICAWPLAVEEGIQASQSGYGISGVSSVASFTETSSTCSSDEGRCCSEDCTQPEANEDVHHEKVFFTTNGASNVASFLETSTTCSSDEGSCCSEDCTQPEAKEDVYHEKVVFTTNGASNVASFVETSTTCSSDEGSCCSEDCTQPEANEDVHHEQVVFTTNGASSIPSQALVNDTTGAETSITSDSAVESCDSEKWAPETDDDRVGGPGVNSYTSFTFTNKLSGAKASNVCGLDEETCSIGHQTVPGAKEGLVLEMPVDSTSATMSPTRAKAGSEDTNFYESESGANRKGNSGHEAQASQKVSKVANKKGSSASGPSGNTNQAKELRAKTKRRRDEKKQVQEASTSSSVTKGNVAGKTTATNTCGEQIGDKQKKWTRDRQSSHKGKPKAGKTKDPSEKLSCQKGPAKSLGAHSAAEPRPNLPTTAHDTKNGRPSKGKNSSSRSVPLNLDALSKEAAKRRNQPNSAFPSRGSQEQEPGITLDNFIDGMIRRGIVVLTNHDKKIEELNGKLSTGKPTKKGKKKKFVAVDEYERRKLEEGVVEQKKRELEAQRQEFVAFEDALFGEMDALHTQKSVTRNDLIEFKQAFDRECHRLETALPIYGSKTALLETVKTHQVSIVLGETGSGKSTQMVQYLYDAGFANTGVIVCTQPRKVAASSLSAYVSKEMNIRQLVGCHVGAHCHKAPRAKILYMTDHALLNECLKDRSLSRYSCVIVDEAHERSIYTDLLLGMIKRALEMRPELRVVITSATIDPELFVKYFTWCPVVKVSGRMFPVDVVWSDGSQSNGTESKADYVLQTVVKSYKIHKEEDEGDILVFLTSPAEVEQACEKLKNMAGERNLECLPLHGKLRQEDQEKVFKKCDGKRKVVFATNCAETSVTIPGIKYVVDSGKVKEMKFDPKRNLSSLEVTDINMSSAEQRKGRAGRTQAGKCYRLYSEEQYRAMNPRSTPEILRVHLGQAVLKLMELGIKDPAEFDFVESPPKESLQGATETLKALGAIREARLTDLGRKMAKVPLEPHLAKLVFQGIDQGVGSEALVLAAVATVNGSIFFRMGSDEEKKRADRQKVQFCQEGGDLLTLLAAYREWSAVSKSQRNKWCYANSLNAKALRIAEDTVKELNLVLKHELRIQVEGTPTEERTSGRDETLRKILLSCYVTNLCMFTGHERAGYRAVRLNQCVQIHPSSALKVFSFNPRFIVYGQLLKTSRDFLLNVTPVEEEWLEESIRESGISLDLKKLKSTALEPESFTCSGELIQRTLLHRGFKGLKDVEDEISRKCDVDAPVVLDVNKSSGCVKLFVQASYRLSAQALLEKRLEEGRQALRSEVREIPVLEGCNTVRALFKSGGVVQRLLMPNMRRSVVSRNVPSECPLEYVLETLKSFGNVVHHKCVHEQRTVFVTYDSPEIVPKVLQESNTFPFGVQLQQPQQHDTKLWNHGLKVKLTWFRRPCKGTAAIGFQYHDDLDEVLYNLGTTSPRINSRPVNYSQDKFDESRLFLWRLAPDVTDQDLRNAFESALPGVRVDKVFIHRQKEFETSQEELDELKATLENAILDRVATKNFQVHMQTPWGKAFNYVASLCFEDAEEGREAIDALEVAGLSTSLAEKITITPQLQCALTCPKQIYAAVEDNVKQIQAQCRQDCQEMCGNRALEVDKRHRGNQVVLTVRSECLDHYIRVTVAIRSQIDGDVIDCSGDSGSDVLLTSAGREVLQGIQEETGAFIHSDPRSMCIKIYGKPQNKDAAKQSINSFLEELLASGSQMWEISLRAPDKPRGLLKAIISRYGVDLVGLEGLKEGVQSVTLDLRRHKLTIKSSEEGYEAIVRCVQECAEALPVELSLSADVPDEMLCVVCFDPVEGDAHRLACCGHAYCLVCAQHQMRAKLVPLQCAHGGCEELFVWRDIQKVVHDKELRDLVDAAIEGYVKANPDKVKYCLTPDCGAIYAVSNEGKPFKCYACETEICTSCHVQYHHGLTCAAFESEKKDGGTQNLDKWLNEEKGNRKRCPKCRAPIEKNGGCNHMVCGQCNTHLCWLCLKMCADGNGFYTHQRTCPARDKNSVY